MTARAQDVLAAQGRLRGLLRANAAVISDLSLPVVLRQIVTAAKDLVQARYAALGIVRNGVLEQFIHVGMQPSEVEQIGELPRGRGILGLLITHPVPVRLTDLSAHPAAVGFPPDHPPMSSLLGVPIRVRDQVFGNLYLTESANGEFSAEDEELAKALAASAGVAIDNARLYEAAHTREQWLQASAAITQQLLAADPGRPLAMIADRSRDIAGADVVTVVLPVPGKPGELEVEVAVGANADDLPGLRLPTAGTLSGEVFTTGKPLRLSS